MAEVLDLWYKIKKYYTFTPLEIRSLAIAIVTIAFIISFNEWGRDSQVSISLGLFNLFNAVLIVTFSLLIHISVQRIWALMAGYRVEWKLWGFGLLFSVIIAFLTNGNVWLILPGGIILHHLAGHRLGYFRYDVNWWAFTVIALSGVAASMLAAVFFAALTGAVNNALIQKMIVFNIAYALYSLLPIPPLDGSRIFYGSRMLYVFSVAGVVAIAILLTLGISIWIALLSSLVVAIILWLLYYIFIENKIWAGV